MIAGDTAFAGNIYWEYASSPAPTVFDAELIDFDDFGEDEAAALAALTNSALNNNVVDPGITVTVDSDGKIVATIPNAGPLYDAANGMALPADDFLESVDYVGAFPQTENWAAWTFAAQEGYLVKPGWIETPTFGWIYSLDGSLTGWLYHQRRDDWIWSLPGDGDSKFVYLP